MQPIIFEPCEDIKLLEQDVQIGNEGHMLVVPVCLRSVYPFREMVVGVQIYINDSLYAMQTRKVFTGRRSYCNKIRNFDAGTFTFLFTDRCTSNICVKVFSHYIY